MIYIYYAYISEKYHNELIEKTFTWVSKGASTKNFEIPQMARCTIIFNRKITSNVWNERFK